LHIKRIAFKLQGKSESLLSRMLSYSRWPPPKWLENNGIGQEFIKAFK